MSCLNGCIIKTLWIRKKWITDVVLILMDGTNKHPCWSSEAKPGQLCCFSHFSSFSHLWEGNPDFFIAVIVISVWILRAVTGAGEVGGQQGAPADKDALRWWWVTQSAKLISLPARGVPLYLCFSRSLQWVPSLPLLFASSHTLCFSSEKSANTIPNRIPSDRKRGVYLNSFWLLLFLSINLFIIIKSICLSFALLR